jgi:hypothetical protein
LPGKYDKITPDLEKLPVEMREGGQVYQDKINQVKASIATREPSELAKEWKAIRAKEDDIETQAKAARLLRRALEQLIETAFEDHGLEMLKLAEGGSVTYRPEPKAVVIDKEAYHEWCVEKGLTPLMNLPWQTTNSDAKQALLDGQPLPPGVSVYTVPKFTLRKK